MTIGLATGVGIVVRVLTHFPARQRVWDASLRLQVVRARSCDAWAAGQRRDVQVQVFGPDNVGLRDWLHDLCWDCSELTAVTSTQCQSVESFAPSHKLNQVLVERGCRMTSFFDTTSGTDAMTEFLIAADGMPYHLAYGPIQLKVFDCERVVLEGPLVEEQRSLMLIRGQEAVNAAGQYLRAVRETAVRASALDTPEAGFTSRQQVIAELLCEGCTDDQIAERLDLSVRSVRYEVARLLDVLQVRTRFAAGVRYARTKAELS
ncbi:LuxR family transcriptional regulator [Kribbella sp. ALI-6-A]|nr:LuxR family transcriptional regulator [Kribbella sp. ALI-6-A]